jgi:hypothetical protein
MQNKSQQKETVRYQMKLYETQGTCLENWGLNHYTTPATRTSSISTQIGGQEGLSDINRIFHHQHGFGPFSGVNKGGFRTFAAVSTNVHFPGAHRQVVKGPQPNSAFVGKRNTFLADFLSRESDGLNQPR